MQPSAFIFSFGTSDLQNEDKQLGEEKISTEVFPRQRKLGLVYEFLLGPRASEKNPEDPTRVSRACSFRGSREVFQHLHARGPLKLHMCFAALK